MDIQLKNLLCGLSLGDGHARKLTGALQIQHGEAQKEYIEYKADLLSKYSGKKVKTIKFDNGKYTGYRIYFSNPYMKQVRNWLYIDSYKYIKPEFLHRLSDLEIAIWYMDDGSLYKKKGKIGKSGTSYELVLSTYCKTEIEASGIIKFFKERYDSNFTIKRNKNRFSIRCGKKSAEKLFNKIGIYIPQCMSYKIFS